MAENKTYNSAQRALLMIEQAIQAPGDKLAVNVLAEVFNVDPQNKAEVVRYLGLFLDLLRQAKEEVMRLENINQELYLQPFNDIAIWLGDINLNGPWLTVKNKFDPGILSSLMFISDRFDWSFKEDLLENTVLDELRKEVEEFLKDIIASDLDRDFKLLLIEKLEDIRNSILYYRFWGVKGIRRAVEESVGAVIVNRQSHTSTAGVDKTKKFMQFVGRVNIVISSVTKIKELVSPIAGKILDIARNIGG